MKDMRTLMEGFKKGLNESDRIRDIEGEVVLLANNGNDETEIRLAIQNKFGNLSRSEDNAMEDMIDSHLDEGFNDKPRSINDRTRKCKNCGESVPWQAGLEDTCVSCGKPWSIKAERPSMKREAVDLSWEVGDRIKYKSLKTGKWRAGTIINKESDGKFVLDNGKIVYENDPDFIKKANLKKESDESTNQRYSTVETEINGFEYVVAYPDNNGIETLEGLYNWESQDPANRELLTANSEEEANGIIKSY